MQLRVRVLVAVGLWCGNALAQPKQQVPALVGADEIMKVTTPSGFIDDVVAYDNQRLAYVVADTGVKAELHVVQLGCATCVQARQEIVVDMSGVTLRPTSLRLLGQRAFVIGATEDGRQIAAMIDLAKKAPAFKLGPATHITIVDRDGRQSVAVHRAIATKSATRHEVELFAIETGRRIAKGRAFELVGDHHRKLDLRVNHWADGWTRASGLKGGEWVKKEDQRSPDTEATYDLITGKIVEDKPVADLVEQRKRFGVLADAGGQLELVRAKADNAGIEIWRRGVPTAVTLDQPLAQYDVKSLQGVVGADGSAWFVLKVDPVNAEAVARKKADPEYLDVFRVGADGQATRVVRLLAKGLRHRFGVIGSYVWLLERSTGFDRGGRALTVYQLAR